jgi:hypothetical protein
MRDPARRFLLPPRTHRRATIPRARTDRHRYLRHARRSRHGRRRCRVRAPRERSWSSKKRSVRSSPATRSIRPARLSTTATWIDLLAAGSSSSSARTIATTACGVAVQDIGCNPDPVGDNLIRQEATSMEPRRFDALARVLATSSSRRSTVRRVATAGIAALLGRLAVGSEAARADHCNYIGCGCSTAPRHACGGGLVCCPSSPGTPGGGGVCSDPADCGGGLHRQRGPCSGSCNWGDSCPGCCSGYCGQYGSCDSAGCTGLGCACASGTFQPCDAGLVCCSSYPGTPGAQGSCQYGC